MTVRNLIKNSINSVNNKKYTPYILTITYVTIFTGLILVIESLSVSRGIKVILFVMLLNTAIILWGMTCSSIAIRDELKKIND